MSLTVEVSSPGLADARPHLALLRASEVFARTLRESGASLARGVDCSRATLAIMRTLDLRGPLPVSELAQVLRVDISVASRQVSLMVDDGLVERLVDEEDRRVRTVALSPAGRLRSQEIEVALEARTREVFAAWTAQELTDSIALLDRLTTCIDTAHSRAGSHPSD